MHHAEPSEGLAGEVAAWRSDLGCVARLRVVDDAYRSTLALFEPVAVAVHLEDVDVVGEPVEQGTGKALGGEDAGPLVERQVRCDDGGAALVALGASKRSSAPVWESGT